jgi:hypothetical protein
MRKLHPKPEGVRKYRGVTWDSRNGMWRCQIMVEGKYHCLGWHKEADVAAMYYDKCKMEAKKFLGDEGRLRRRDKTNVELGHIKPLTPEALELLASGLGKVGGVNPGLKKRKTVQL